jgi:hypothetical protein
VLNDHAVPRNTAISQIATNMNSIAAMWFVTSQKNGVSMRSAGIADGRNCVVASLLKRWLMGTHQGGIQHRLSTTTSTNSPSASMAGAPTPAGCSCIAPLSRPLP